MTRAIYILFLAAAVLAFSGCDRQNTTTEQVTGSEAGNVRTTPSEPAPNVGAAMAPAGGAMGNPHGGGAAGLRQGVVKETMDAASYTYVLVESEGKEFWAAGPKTALKVGDKIEVPTGSLMVDFHSKTLDRTFPEIDFVSSFMIAGGDNAAGLDPHEGKMVANAHAKAKADAGEQPAPVVANVAKLDGGLTIAEVYAQRAELHGKEVALRGQVVKFNAQIMGSNWIHIQDGSGDSAKGTNDLTVTTSAVVKVGDVVVVKGPLSSDKDFGAGYKFAAIVENGTVTAE